MAEEQEIDTKEVKAAVFISYNHNDREVTDRLSEVLTKEGFRVILDHSSMMAGEGIQEFIEESVKQSDATISIVSRQSLLSAWVAMESSLSFYRNAFNDDRRFIPCYIEDDFLDARFVDEALDHIDVELEIILKSINERNEKRRHTRDLDGYKDRYYELRNNIDKIVGRLRESLSIDISGDNFDKGLIRVIYSLNSIQVKAIPTREAGIKSGPPASSHKETTRLTHIPQILAKEVIGRSEDLHNLESLIEEGNQSVLLRGIGGIGKTTLARNYISKHLNDYDHVAWIEVIAEEGQVLRDFRSVAASHQELFKKLNLPFDLNVDEETRFPMVIDAMRNLSGQNLLVIDNATKSFQAMVSVLPQLTHWKILVTSRADIKGIKQYNIGELGFKAARGLFKKHSEKAKETADKDFKVLFKEIDSHTLTIELLAKALDESLELNTVKELTQHLKVDAIKDPVFQEEVWSGYNKKEQSIFGHLIAAFQLNSLTDDEIYLLKQFAVLPPIPIDVSLLYQFFLEKDDEAEKRRINNNLKSLAKLSWLGREGNQFKIHRIIQQGTLLQHKISVQDCAIMIDNLSSLIDRGPYGNPIDSFHYVVYAQSILNAFNISQIDKVEEEKRISLLQNNLALVLQDLGDYEGAKELLEKAKTLDEKNFGTDHPTTAVSYSNLALVLQDLGDYDGAKDLLEKAKTSDEKNFGTDHPTTAVSYSNLALVLKALGDFEGAKELLEKAKTSAEKNFGTDHPTTAVSYSNLALVLQDLGDFEGAKDLLEKAKTSAEKNFGTDHPTTAVSYSNLALVLQDLGDFEGAKDLLEKAKTSAEKNFGTDHPTTAGRYSNLATVLKALGDFEGAKDLLEKAKTSDEKNFGTDHPTTAVSYSNLATVLQDLGDFEGAKDLLEKAKTSDEKNFGTDHPTTAVRYSNLALVLQDLGDYEGAKDLFEKAKTSDEKNFGTDHPTTAVSYSNLATVLKDLGDFEGAKDLLEKAKTSAEKNFGTDHPTTAVRYSNLALVLQDLGDFEGALELSGKSVAIFKKILPPGHPNISTANDIYNSIKQQLK